LVIYAISESGYGLYIEIKENLLMLFCNCSEENGLYSRGKKEKKPSPHSFFLTAQTSFCNFSHEFLNYFFGIVSRDGG
jgi:hypothetical protein